MKTRIEAAVLEQAQVELRSIKTEDDRTVGQDQRISVVVSDASYMNSELLARALHRTKGLNILRCTAHFHETLEAIVRFAPDVNVLSMHFSDGPYKGLELLRRARELSVKTRFVVLMDEAEHDGIIDAFRAGARGVFRRSTSMHFLSRCIGAVHSGQIWASSADLLEVLDALQKAMPFRCVNSRGEALLTKREQDLVPLVASGLTNREISAQLGISEHTIKNHLFRMYEKLGISSRVELILYAVSERSGDLRSA